MSVNSISGRRYLMMAALIALIAGLAFLLSTSDEASATCTPPGTGDWVINNGETCTISSPATIDITGDLVVQTGGNLTLNGVELRMNGATDGQRTIDVQLGGALNAITGANISALDPNFEYRFLVRNGATVTIDHSTVQDCGFSTTADENIGMRIESSSVTISHSTFTNNYAGIYVKGSSPKVHNSTFTFNEYGMLIGSMASPTIADDLVTSNTYGIFCERSTPTILNNEVQAHSEAGIYLFQSNAQVIGNEMYDNWYAIAVLYSSPTIKGNDITWNEDGIRAMFGDPVIEGNHFGDNYGVVAYFGHTGGRMQGNTIRETMDQGATLTGEGIVLHKARTTIKDNNIISLHWKLAAMIIEAGSDVDIIGNKFLYNGSIAINVKGSSTVRIEGNNISYPIYGIGLQACQGHIKDNMFYNTTYAIDAAIVNTSMVIDGNTFQKNSKRGISLIEGHPAISDNTFRDNPVAILCKLSNPRVLGNRFFDNGIAIEIREHSDIYFADNLVRHGNYTVFASRAKAELENNTIELSAIYSVYMSNGSYGKLVGNHISGNDRTGVYFIKSDGWLINNTFTDSGKGIYATEAYFVTEGNLFENNEVGIFLDKTTVHMYGDTIRKSSVIAIMVMVGEVHMEGVLIENGTEGTSFTGADVWVHDCTFRNGTRGISAMDKTDIVVRDSRFYDHDDEGIYVVGGTMTVEDCEFTNNHYGLEVIDSPFTVKGSLFRYGERGIYTEMYSAVIRDCIFEMQDDAGVFAYDAMVDIKGSSIRHSRNGISAEKVILKVVDCDIEDNADVGVLINSTTTYIKDSRLRWNRDGLFDIGGSQVDIVDCNMSSNEVYGVYTDDSTEYSDITITRKIILQDNRFLLRGELTVEDNAELILLRVHFVFYSLDAGEAGATIRTGGRIQLRESITTAHISVPSPIGYHFEVEKGSGLTMVNTTIRHCGMGIPGDAGFTVRTSYTSVTETLFDENKIGLMVIGTTFTGHDIRFKNNTIGFLVSSGEMNLINSSVKGSKGKDLVLQTSKATLLNTQITYMLADVQDEGSILLVMWYMHVSVTWNDGQPVPGAIVYVTDKSGTIQSRTVDDQGYVRWMEVKEYHKKGPTDNGYFSYAPLTINVTEKGLSAERSEYISTETTITIILVDESPPMMEITNPDDGSVVYDSEILVLGTASDTGSIITAIDVSIDGVAWLPADGTTFWAINLTVPEGFHTIMARGTDARGNVRTVSISIEVDLTSPLLLVESPSDGHVTNQTSVMVKGKVHVGGDLIINGDQVQMTQNGTFSYEVFLSEGPNTVQLKALARNGLETMEVSMTVFRDTAPPEIDLLYPSPGSIINSSTVTVTVASNEDVSFQIGGLSVDTFGGQADVYMELIEGKNYIHVVAIDMAGNRNSTVFIVELDVTLPELVIEKPGNPVFTTTKERLVISGRTEPGAELLIDGKTVQTTADGNFTLKKKLRYGDNTVVIRSTDKANNTSEMILEVEREQVQDNTSYMWLAVLAVIAGVGADVGTLLYFKRYYKAKGGSQGKGMGGPGGGAGDQDDDDEELDDIEDDDDVAAERVRPAAGPRSGREMGSGRAQRPGRGQQQTGREPLRQARKGPQYGRRPPQKAPPAGHQHMDEAEFEEIEDMGEF